jgi:hypothetical protein
VVKPSEFTTKTSGFSPVNKTSLYDLDPASAPTLSADAAALGGGMSLTRVPDLWADGFLACTDKVGTLVVIVFR